MNTIDRPRRLGCLVATLTLAGLLGCSSEAVDPSSTSAPDATAADGEHTGQVSGDSSSPVGLDGAASDEPGEPSESSSSGSTDSGGGARDVGTEIIAPVKTLAELQNDFMTLKLGMFLHFNMGTFTGEEWATPHGDPKRFNPVGLDANQWADAAVAAGVKYVVLTTKHHDGFCLWNSAYTDYDVGSSPWKGGLGDVVKEYVDAMRSHGLLVGFYFSIWDRTNGDASGLPTTDLIKNQLKELLTNYGPVSLLWFDGWGWQTAVTYNRIPYQGIRDYIRTLQPNVLVLENNHEHSLAHTDIVGYERNVEGTPPAGNMFPAEVADNIRSDGKWFFSTGECNLKPIATLRTSLTDVGKNHSNYLLDLTPNQQGHIPDCQVQLLAQLK